MSTTLLSTERLRRALTNPTQGVLGLVDELLAASWEQNLRLDWKVDHCRVQLLGCGTSDFIDVPLRKSVVRAVLARIAVLCNERNPNSVSPYEGDGELLVGVARDRVIRAVFVNSPDIQRLELTPLSCSGDDKPPRAQTDQQEPEKIADPA